MTISAQVKKASANLKGIHGTLQTYAVQTEHQETKAAFREAAEETGAIINDLEKRLQGLEFMEPQYKGY